jgi:hypothetical protein
MLPAAPLAAVLSQTTSPDVAQVGLAGMLPPFARDAGAASAGASAATPAMAAALMSAREENVGRCMVRSEPAFEVRARRQRAAAPLQSAVMATICGAADAQPRETVKSIVAACRDAAAQSHVTPCRPAALQRRGDASIPTSGAASALRLLHEFLQLASSPSSRSLLSNGVCSSSPATRPRCLSAYYPRGRPATHLRVGWPFEGDRPRMHLQRRQPDDAQRFGHCEINTVV